MSPTALCRLCLASLLATTVWAGTVLKLVEPFDTLPWPASTPSAAIGRATLSDDVPPGIASRRSLRLEVRFSGKGFEWSGVDAPEPLWIPGRAHAVTLRCKKSDRRYSLHARFRDGWDRTQVGNSKLEWSLATKSDGQWHTLRFAIPDDWVRPVALTGFGCHNWSARSTAKAVSFWLDHIEVETDLTDVDAKSGLLKSWRPSLDGKAQAPPKTPLLTLRLATLEVSNVFSRNAPEARVQLRNWRSQPRTGSLTCRVLDDAGRPVHTHKQAVSLADVWASTLPLPVERFGRYAVEVAFSPAEGTPLAERLVFARVPPAPGLTREQKLASPYGVNVHGGKALSPIEPFRKAGVVWFRDYAFNFPTLLKAKGGDKRYAGWPWYPQLVQRYADAGAMLLPCSQKAIRPPQVRDGKVVGHIGPDRAWIREVADVLGAFPQLTHWELDNEYDLGKENARAEALCDWRNYRAYHKAFADVLALLGAGEVTAVEQGRAGIWPERLRRCIVSGDFAKLAVVNSHHYCGVSPPERDFGPLDAGLDADEKRRPMAFFDRLRAVKRAAQSVGRSRESWLTEFGWDTLAGKVVSPREQAVYLARGWMLAMAAGTDKCFWFYDYDAPNPKQFFDGCGLLDAKGGPKLSLCALAGLTSLLPSPRLVGTVNAGPNTWGCVFESGGKLVASLWTIEGDDGPTVTFQAEQLYDYLGNKLPGKAARLTMAPVYAVGLTKTDPLYAQTAYSLDSPHLVVAAAGDTVAAVVRVHNNRPDPIRCSIRAKLPPGWATGHATQATVAPGDAKNVPLALGVRPGEPVGLRKAEIAIQEDGFETTLPLKLLVRAAIALDVGPLTGRPGPATVAVKVANRTSQPLDATLRLRLPKTWKAARPELGIEALKPQEVREVECDLTWTTDWAPAERAEVELDAGRGRRVVRSIIPSHTRLRRAKALKLDGRLDEWPKEAELPAWMLGSTVGKPNARVFLAWSPEGLFGAVEVRDSKLQTSDPRSFWAGDCLELFLDTRDDKRHRLFEPGDHQFWLVPLVDQGRVYVGQWKRKTEIPATRYDIQGIRSAARRTPDGYAMEFLLPARLLTGYRPKAGARLGLNLNLTVKGRRLDREVYWPRRKDWGVMNLPKTWGSVELAD